MSHDFHEVQSIFHYFTNYLELLRADYTSLDNYYFLNRLILCTDVQCHIAIDVISDVFYIFSQYSSSKKSTLTLNLSIVSVCCNSAVSRVPGCF